MCIPYAVLYHDSTVGVEVNAKTSNRLGCYGYMVQVTVSSIVQRGYSRLYICKISIV